MRRCASAAAAESSQETFANATTRDAQLAQLDALIGTWAATSTLSGIEARAAAAGYLVSFTFGTRASDAYASTTQWTYTGSGTDTAALIGWYNDSQNPTYRAWLDKLERLERFNGRPFFQFNPAGAVTCSYTDAATGTGTTLYGLPRIRINLSDAQLTSLDQSYAALRASVYDNLFLQTRGQALLDAIGLSIDAAGDIVLVAANDSQLDDRAMRVKRVA